VQGTAAAADVSATAATAVMPWVMWGRSQIFSAKSSPIAGGTTTAENFGEEGLKGKVTWNMCFVSSMSLLGSARDDPRCTTCRITCDDAN